MSLTALDPRTALVLIDLQQGIFGLVDPQALAQPLARAADLAAAFRAQHLPVVPVRVDFAPDWADAPRNRTNVSSPTGPPPANWTQPLPELHQQPTDVVMTKRQPGAFYGTDLDLQLRRRGITGIVPGGVATSLGVESTGRAGYDLGYNMTFAVDAMADPNPTAHDHSVHVTFPHFGEVDTTQAIIAALATTPQASA
jgi:nicotinamidase-related amidase